METLRRDLRYAVRMIRKTPGFTAVVVVTLALGIGANTSIFSVIHGVLLRPFPFHEPERVAVVWETQHTYGLPFMYASPPNYMDWREQNTVFEDLAAYDVDARFLDHGEESSRLQVAEVSASLFGLLGVEPALGRRFASEEDRAGGEPVAILSDALWQSRFASDPGVPGTVITLDDLRYTVVGVMPPSFTFPPPIDLEGSNPFSKTDLWVPLARDLAGESRGAHHLTVLGRLAPGVTFQAAAAEMTTIAARMEQAFPSSNAGWGVTLVPLTRQVLGDFRPALMVLLGAVGFVLLIACVNVANLLLARGAHRQRECAIRTALGARPWHLVRQLLTESLVLALLGGAAGLLLATWGTDLMLRLAPRNIPRLDEVGVDLTVITFTVAASLLTGVIFGLAPALQSAAPDVNSWLKEGGRSGGQGSRGARLRSALVIAEVALSLVLLVGAGLLVRSFIRLQGVDPGFRPGNVLTLRVGLSQTRYPERGSWIPRYRELEAELAALPGVEAAGFIHDIPLGADRQGTSFRIAGEPALDSDENRLINHSFTTPGYFDAMGIGLRRGRLFSAQDGPDSEDVVVVNEAFAARFLEGRDPLATRLHLGSPSEGGRRIVGVVGDVRHDKLERDSTPTAYLPYYQVPSDRSLYLALRSSAEPGALASSVRARLAALEPDARLYEVRSMSQVLEQSVAQPRFSTLLLGAFATVALLLAAVGIYGVISYSVSQRVRDIGIRMALGAGRGAVFRLVVGQGMSLTLAGVALGLGAALGLTRFLESLLFGVASRDLPTFASIAAVLAAVAFLACYLPARRATRVDPMVALRHE